MHIQTFFIPFNVLANAELPVTISYIVLIPVLAAFIGWGTNHLAVKMLFHPQNPITLMGLTTQGSLSQKTCPTCGKTRNLSL